MVRWKRSRLSHQRNFYDCSWCLLTRYLAAAVRCWIICICGVFSLNHSWTNVHWHHKQLGNFFSSHFWSMVGSQMPVILVIIISCHYFNVRAKSTHIQIYSRCIRNNSKIIFKLNVNRICHCFVRLRSNLWQKWCNFFRTANTAWTLWCCLWTINAHVFYKNGMLFVSLPSIVNIFGLWFFSLFFAISTLFWYIVHCEAVANILVYHRTFDLCEWK